MNVNRDVIERLERLGLRYYVTGSWALSAYGQARQTADMDVVIDLSPDGYERLLRPAFEPDYLVNDPIITGRRAFGGVLHIGLVMKADLIMRWGDEWSRSAMERRLRIDHPGLGPAWCISPEDLLLAKLEWSEGVSELQLRDCRSLVRLNPDLDWGYVERYAGALGVRSLLEQVRAD